MGHTHVHLYLRILTPGLIPGPAVRGLTRTAVGLQRMLVHEEVHPSILYHLQVILECVDSSHFNIFWLQLIPSVDHPVREEMVSCLGPAVVLLKLKGVSSSS